MTALATVQKAVARVGFVPEELAPIQAKIGEIGGLIEADCKLVAVITKSKLSSSSRLTALLRMAAGETAPLGPVADKARAEVLKMTRTPEVRAELARSPEQLEAVRSLLQAAA